MSSTTETSRLTGLLLGHRAMPDGSFLQRLSTRTWQTMLQAQPRTRVFARDELLPLDADDRYVYIVIEGCVRQDRFPLGTAPGMPTITRFRGIGQLVGEAKLIGEAKLTDPRSRQGRSHVPTRCLSQTVVIPWRARYMNQLLRRQPEVQLALLRSLEDRSRSDELVYGTATRPPSSASAGSSPTSPTSPACPTPEPPGTPSSPARAKKTWPQPSRSAPPPWKTPSEPCATTVSSKPGTASSSSTTSRPCASSPPQHRTAPAPWTPAPGPTTPPVRPSPRTGVPANGQHHDDQLHHAGARHQRRHPCGDRRLRPLRRRPGHVHPPAPQESLRLDEEDPKKDEESAELNKPAEWLDDLYKAQCGLAQKPCRATDFEDVTRIGNMIKGVAEHTEALRPELAKVVERIENYVATALAEPGLNTKVSLLEHRTQLVGAMKQEATRNELARAIITAQQKIKLLRRS